MKRFWSSMLVLVMLMVFAFPAIAVGDTGDAALVGLSSADVIEYVGSALFVVVVINALKKLYGLGGQVILPIALMLGVALQMLVYYFGDVEVFAIAMRGILYGGSAGGAWVLRQR